MLFSIDYVGLTHHRKTSLADNSQKEKMMNTKRNLCDSCSINNVPVCLTDDIVFGNGVGNDNIIKCKNYKRMSFSESIIKTSKNKALIKAMKKEAQQVIQPDNAQ